MNKVAPALKSEPEVITTRFVDVDLAKKENIVEAVRIYLKEDEGLGEEKVAEIVQMGELVLGQLLPQLGITSGASSGDVPDEEESPVKDSIIIEDPVAWKATLPLSKAARPVRPLIEYEENALKL